MAKRKLTDVAIVYIDAKRNVLNAAELSKILGFTERSIQEYIDANPVAPKEDKAQPHTTEAQQPDTPEKFGPQFIHKTGMGNAGVAICTPQASEFGDAVRKSRPTNPNRKFNDCTTKIKK